MEKKNMGHPGLEAAADAATLASGLALPPTKPSEVLAKAADLLEKPGGWGQGNWASKRGERLAGQLIHLGDCFCVEGAIALVSGIAPISAYSHPAACRLADDLKVPIGELPVWNDAPDRTQAEVVSALRQAAEKAREAGQ